MRNILEGSSRIYIYKRVLSVLLYNLYVVNCPSFFHQMNLITNFIFHLDKSLTYRRINYNNVCDLWTVVLL